MGKKLKDMRDDELLVAVSAECWRILNGPPAASALWRLSDMGWELERRINWTRPSDHLVLLRAACAFNYALESDFLMEAGEDALAGNVASRVVEAIQEVNRHLEERAAGVGDEEKAYMIQKFFIDKLQATANNHIRESGIDHRRKYSRLSPDSPRSGPL